MSAAGRSLKNHNKLLWDCSGVVGVKTGFTESAGRSLVSCAEREDMRLVCVTLDDPDDWGDHTALYDWAYGHYQIVRVMKDGGTYGTLPIISGVKDVATVRPAEDYIAVYPKSDDVTVLGKCRNSLTPRTGGPAGRRYHDYTQRQNRKRPSSSSTAKRSRLTRAYP